MECWGRRDPRSREYKDPTPSAVLVSSSLGIEHFGNERSKDEVAGAVPPAPSPHLRDSGLTVVVSVLGHPSKQANCWRSLHCQHWRHENQAPWIARWWQKNHKVEVRRTAGGLGKHQVGALLPKPFVHSESHPLKANKQTPQRPSCRPLWHREDLRVDN